MDTDGGKSDFYVSDRDGNFTFSQRIEQLRRSFWLTDMIRRHSPVESRWHRNSVIPANLRKGEVRLQRRAGPAFEREKVANDAGSARGRHGPAACLKRMASIISSARARRRACALFSRFTKRCAGNRTIRLSYRCHEEKFSGRATPGWQNYNRTHGT